MPRLLLLVSALLLAFSAQRAKSWLNRYYNLLFLDGHTEMVWEEPDVQDWSYKTGLRSFERAALLVDSARHAESLATGSNDHRIRSDYAVDLIMLGHYRAAIDTLRAIERDRPGLYSTAANLGTAYELIGEIDSAYRWIEEDMRRDPGGHRGSEWIHLNILAAKRELRRDPRWLATHSVLGIDFGDGVIPVPPARLSLDSLRTVDAHLATQLHERAAFVAANDPLVADLIADQAAIASLLYPLGRVPFMYSTARNLGYQRPELALRRERYATTLLRLHAFHIGEVPWSALPLRYGAYAFLALVALYIVIRSVRQA